jgi:hypothetical protein
MFGGSMKSWWTTRSISSIEYSVSVLMCFHWSMQSFLHWLVGPNREINAIHSDLICFDLYRYTPVMSKLVRLFFFFSIATFWIKKYQTATHWKLNTKIPHFHFFHFCSLHLIWWYSIAYDFFFHSSHMRWRYSIEKNNFFAFYSSTQVLPGYLLYPLLRLQQHHLHLH